VLGPLVFVILGSRDLGAHRADSSVGDRDRAVDNMRRVPDLDISPARKTGIFFRVATDATTKLDRICRFARAAAKKREKTPGAIAHPGVSVQSVSLWCRWRHSTKPTVGVNRHVRAVTSEPTQ
jgi:hypothetical protein